MIIKSLAELQQADEGSLMFNPLGLGGRMRPEDTAEFQQRVVARHELVPVVTEGTRRSFEQLRDDVAHPSTYNLCMPVDAASTISDLAEIINHLWGSATPGGRFHHAPVRRTVVALMWNEERGVVSAGAVAPLAGSHRPSVGERGRRAKR